MIERFPADPTDERLRRTDATLQREQVACLMALAANHPGADASPPPAALLSLLATAEADAWRSMAVLLNRPMTGTPSRMAALDALRTRATAASSSTASPAGAASTCTWAEIRARLAALRHLLETRHRLGDDPQEQTAALVAEQSQPEDGGSGPDAADTIILELAQPIAAWSRDGESGLERRFARVRHQLADRTGVVPPPITIRGDATGERGHYRVLISGERCGEGRLHLDRRMAIDGGNVGDPYPRNHDTDPVFGLPVVWITPEQSESARRRGYTVVDPDTVLTTHLSEVLHTELHRIFGAAALDGLLAHARTTSPELVDDLLRRLPRPVIAEVLRDLLREDLSLRDHRTVFEALAAAATPDAQPHALTKQVRRALRRHITGRFSDLDGVLWSIELDPQVEQLLLGALQTHAEAPPTLSLKPGAARAFVEGIRQVIDQAGDLEVVLLCPAGVRSALRRFLEPELEFLPVLCREEIVPDAGSVNHLGRVTLTRRSR